MTVKASFLNAIARLSQARRKAREKEALAILDAQKRRPALANDGIVLNGLFGRSMYYLGPRILSKDMRTQ